MQNEAELHFFRKLLEQFHVNFRILGEHDRTDPGAGFRTAPSFES